MIFRDKTVCAVGYKCGDDSLLAEALAAIPPKTKIAAVTPPKVLDEATVHKLAYASGVTLNRVAGNVYENKASRDYWTVRNGKLVRLTGSTEVDDGEHLDPADLNDPEASLNRILADLDF